MILGMGRISVRLTITERMFRYCGGVQEIILPRFLFAVGSSGTVNYIWGSQDRFSSSLCVLACQLLYAVGAGTPSVCKHWL